MPFQSRPWVAVAAVSMAALGCSVLDNLPGIGGGGGAEVLFEDDFSDTSSGWDRVQDANHITDYENGGYRIWVGPDLVDVWANPGRSFTDVRLEVDATKQGGDDNNNFGVICRSQGADDFYSLWISSDGFYAFVKFQAGGWEFIADFERHDAIRQGNATNHIRADCVGTELTLYANGTLLGSVNDSTFSSGDVGLEAGVVQVDGTDILFDNFVVYQP